jgi:biopolymer transport protein TolR
MRSSRRNIQPLAFINVTNLVDVCMTLLIIFMITAPMMRSGLEVALPKADSSKPQIDEGLTVILTSGGKILINDQPVSRKAFAQVMTGLLAKNTNRSVYLKADKSVSYGLVVEIIGQLKELKVNNLGLVTEPRAIK